MTRGLLWLPLLIVFFWLAWAGWNEFQKLEAYRIWAEPFDRAKYDIYSVLGQKGSNLTWGKPTRKGPVALQTFSLYQVESMQLQVNDQIVDLDRASEDSTFSQRNIVLSFCLANSMADIHIPFTEATLAVKWGKYLQKEWRQLQSNPSAPLISP
jgi:hypothetical protein